MDHIVALLFQRIGAGQQRHDVEGRDFLAAAAVGGVGRVHACMIGGVYGSGASAGHGTLWAVALDAPSFWRSAH